MKSGTVRQKNTTDGGRPAEAEILSTYSPCRVTLLSGIVGNTVVLGSFAAGLGSLGLVWYLDRHRGHPAATWFMATLTFQALSAIGYSAGLLIFDPLWRGYAEAFVWIGLAWIGPLFLGFALEYTGRTAVIRSSGFRLLFVFPVGTTLLAATYPYHDLLWVDFRSAPVFDLSTVLYSIQPWGYATVAVSLLAAGVGVLLLVETILNYGPLYRREAIAVTLSTLPPVAALCVWLAGIGPWPALNLTLLFLLPHVAIDAYAFVGTHMFETNPTTQRAAEQSALDDLKDPMLTVDTTEQVVNLNERAKQLFDVGGQGVLPVPLESLTGDRLEGMRTAGEITVPGSAGGVFAVSYTPLTDPRGDTVGGMIVLYDVTEERQREQQLAVFNRVLRHNLRNEMTVVRGHAEMIADDSDDPQHSSQAESIVGSSQRLLSIAEKAKEFDRIKGGKRETTEVDVSTLIEGIKKEMYESRPEASVTSEIASSKTSVRTDSALLSQAVSNLVENAIVHADDDPNVTVRVFEISGDRMGTVFEVRDTNERIADLEIATIEAGDETPLQHGRGIGLWIVKWCVTALKGEIEFRYDGGNVVTVTLPTA